MEVVFEHLKHLKAFAIECRPCVLEKKPNGAVLEGSTNLAFPELTGQGVPHVGDKEVVRPRRGKTGVPKPKKNEVPSLEVIFPRLDREESEAINWKWDRVSDRLGRGWRWRSEKVARSGRHR